MRNENTHSTPFFNVKLNLRPFWPTIEAKHP